MKIYNIVHTAYWGGASMEIDARSPIPTGWTSATPIEPVPEGQYNRLADALTFELTDIPPEPAPVLPAPPTRIDTPLFLMRFTPQERIALRERAQETDMTGKVLADWLMILNDPRLAYVEVGDPNLTAAMAMLVDTELLTQARADEILAI